MNKAKDKQMRAIVDAYHDSGMGPKKFAISQRLSVYQLKYWVKKFDPSKNEKSSSPSFIQLSPYQSKPSEDWLEIYYPNGVKIKATKSDLPFLSQLISLY
jgi:hypothetical protein